jgi:hypothetical protein
MIGCSELGFRLLGCRAARLLGTRVSADGLLETRDPSAERRMSSRGVTLTELLVVAGLLFLVLTLLIVPMLGGLNIMEQGESKTDVQTAGRRAMSSMSRELAEAMYVFDLPADGSQITFLLPSGSPPPGPAGVSQPAVRYARFVTRFVPGSPWRASEVVGRVELSTEAEPFRDLNANGKWDQGESFTDINGNGRWDPAEAPDPAAPDPDQRADFDRFRDPPIILATYPTDPGAPVPLNPSARRRVRSLTPNSLGFEAPVLQFSPRVVEDEPARPVRTVARFDYSVLASQFGLWMSPRQTDASFERAQFPTDAFFDRFFPQPVPLVEVWRGQRLIYHTVVEWEGSGAGRRIRGLWVVQHTHPEDPSNHEGEDKQLSRGLAYPVGEYPARTPTAPDAGGGIYSFQHVYGFGIDYDRGLLRFAFPGSTPPDFKTAPEAVTGGPGVEYVLPGLSKLPYAALIAEKVGVTVGGVRFRRVSGDPGPGEFTVRGVSIRFDPDNAPSPGRRLAVDYEYRNNPYAEEFFPRTDIFEADGRAEYVIPSMEFASDGGVDEGSAVLTVNGSPYRLVEAGPSGQQYSIEGNRLIFDARNPPAQGSVVAFDYRYFQGQVGEENGVRANLSDGDTVRVSYGTKALIRISLTTAKRRRSTYKLEAFHVEGQVKLKNAPQ